jgi:plasmid maintenance system antidote protein VapI
MTNLAKILKLYIAANDLEIKNVAELLHMSPITLSRFLAGKKIDTDQLLSVMQWLMREA